MLLMIIILSSCKKESDIIDESKSYIKVDGIEYPLTKGIYWEKYDSTANSYLIIVALYSGFTEVKIEYGMLNTQGEGSILYFGLCCPNSEISTHNYIIDGSDNLFSCFNALYYCGCDENYNCEVEGISIKDSKGSISITKNGDTYSVSFHFNAEKNREFGMKVLGHYNGNIPYTVCPD